VRGIPALGCIQGWGLSAWSLCEPVAPEFFRLPVVFFRPFTLQNVAGHDNIKTAMRYVHPREAVVHKLYERLEDLQRPEERLACNKSVQNPVQSEMPSQDELVKLLMTGNLKSAEVVELADTPS
jgi:hypothetical protein